MVRVSNATLYGAEGFVRLPDGSFTMQTVWYPEQLTFHPNYYRRRQVTTRFRSGCYHPLIQYWSRSYYHWMVETLPLLHGIEPFLSTITRHIVPGPLAPFQKQTLELLDIRADSFIEIPSDEAWLIETLTIAPPATLEPRDKADIPGFIGHVFHQPDNPFFGPFNHSPDALRWLARRFKHAAGINDHALPIRQSRILISRRKASCRRLNEVDLGSVLGEFEIDIVELESLSIIEQIRLFDGAELIVAAHGAGLSNLMFCRSGTAVVEIFESSVIRLCYWAISDTFDLDYHYLIGTSLATGNPDPDISVATDDLRGVLLQVTADRNART